MKPYSQLSEFPLLWKPRSETRATAKLDIGIWYLHVPSDAVCGNNIWTRAMGSVRFAVKS